MTIYDRHLVLLVGLKLVNNYLSRMNAFLLRISTEDGDNILYKYEDIVVTVRDITNFLTDCAVGENVSYFIILIFVSYF